MSITIESAETRLPVAPSHIGNVNIDRITPYMDGQHLDEPREEIEVFDSKNIHPAAKAAHENLQFSAELL